MANLRKVCKLCERGIPQVDYKDEHLLSRFITDRGKILPRRATGSCARHQRQIATAIERGRYLALLPYIRDYR
jgi:small subunit ribosomal protein S18